MWARDTDLIGNASGGGRGVELQGVRFTTWGNGVQWENTASSVMALLHYRRHFDPLGCLLPTEHASYILDKPRRASTCYMIDRDPIAT